MNIYQDAERIYRAAGAELGQDTELPKVPVPHYPIFDTALAACLGTLEIPFRPYDPITDDHNADTGVRRKCFWMGNVSRDTTHTTEYLMGAWQEREKFEAENPLHPLVYMRAALDARTWWLKAMRGWPGEKGKADSAAVFGTDNLAKAALLKAVGFIPVDFNGHAFLLESLCQGVPAAKILAESQKVEGASPPQWMWKCLSNYNHLLGIAKGTIPIIRQNVDGQTLILRADASGKTRDKFHSLL